MKSICFFNNKGGVGKTTLICNVASYIAINRGLRVLLIDADPQCNATQLVLSEVDAMMLYDPDALGESAENGTHTLLDALQPIIEGDSRVADDIVPVSGDTNRFGIDLLPGHPHMSLMEDRLSRAWLEFSAAEIGGARKTNWSTQLLAQFADNYDIIFVDVGPSLGALNRSALIGADYFVTPMGCDIFSVMGVRNISAWMTTWLAEYKDSFAKTKEKNAGSKAFERYPLRQDVDEISRYAGYTVQQYITKSKAGVRRATKAYEKILAKIPDTVWDSLRSLKADNVGKGNLHLGDVPNMFSLVPLAQAANTPVHSVESADGLVGAQYSQKAQYVAFIQNLSESILRNVEAEEDE